MTEKISKDTILKEILEIPGATEVLTKYNVPCLSCPFAGDEMAHLKIGQIAKIYGIDLKGLIAELKEKLKNR